MNKLLSSIWSILLICLALFWSLEAVIWLSVKVPQDSPLFIYIILALLIPVWFYWNIKWLLRASKIPVFLLLTSQVFKFMNLKEPFVYKLKMAFSKMDIYSKITKIRSLDKNESVSEYIAGNCFLVPSFMLEHDEPSARALSLDVWNKSPDAQKLYDRVAKGAAGVIVGAIIIFSFTFPCLFLGSLYLILFMLQKQMVENNIFILASLVVSIFYFLALSMVLIFYRIYCFLWPNKDYMQFFANYLKSANYVYKPENLTFKAEDITAMFMTCISAVFTIWNMMKFIK